MMKVLVWCHLKYVNRLHTAHIVFIVILLTIIVIIIVTYISHSHVLLYSVYKMSDDLVSSLLVAI